MIKIKTIEEIKIMKEGGRILAEMLRKLKEKIKPGIKTKDLEKFAKELIKNSGVKPAFLGFNGYPAVLCVSLNEEIVHSLPSERIIKNGDLVSLDFGIKYKNLYLDSAITVLVEPLKDDPALDLKNRLLQTTKECLDLAISETKVGNYLGDISYLIEKHAKEKNFSVIRNLVGHGIGYQLHEKPEVPNFGEGKTGLKLKEGMVLAIEPMLSVGSSEAIEDKKTFAWKTKDNSLSCHFEHTVAITKEGPLILTSLN